VQLTGGLAGLRADREGGLADGALQHVEDVEPEVPDAVEEEDALRCEPDLARVDGGSASRGTMGMGLLPSKMKSTRSSTRLTGMTLIPSPTASLAWQAGTRKVVMPCARAARR
jgi:hypothetical protein